MTVSLNSLESCADAVTFDKWKAPVRTGTGRYALLDCWRGIACLMVVIAHVSEIAAQKYLDDQVPIPDLAGHCVVALVAFRAGVQIFFVISGYCISATVEGFGRGQKSVAQYFSRRFWRIYPPYWALFILMTMAVTASEFASSQGWIPGSLHNTKSPATLTMSQLVGNITLTETWRHHLFGSSKKFFLTHAWTLCYEEQFYLIVGLTLLLFPKRFFQSIAGVTIACLCLMVATGFDFIDVTGFGFDRLWLPFAIGVLVYYRVSYSTCGEQRFIDGGLACLALVTTIASFVPWNWTAYSYSIVRSLATSACFALLLVRLHHRDAILAEKPLSRVLAFVGHISYSLYLVHAPVLFVVTRILLKAGIRSDLQTLTLTIPFCLALSIPLAWFFLSYLNDRFFIEKSPFNSMVFGWQQPAERFSRLACGQRLPSNRTKPCVTLVGFTQDGEIPLGV